MPDEPVGPVTPPISSGDLPARPSWGSIIEVDGVWRMMEDQASIGLWSEATFGPADPNGTALPLRLLKEVVELCRAAGATYLEVRQPIMDAYVGLAMDERRPESEHVDEEIDDCAIVLDVYAQARGHNIPRGKTRKMGINRARTWVRHGDGTGQHVEENPKPQET